MSLVRIILREEIYRLGAAGDVVSVKPGYARNFLLPQGKAVLATQGRVKEIEHQQRIISDRRAKELKDLEALKARVEAVVLEFEAQVGEEGKLFGSVTAQQLADQLAEKGQVVDRRKISLEEPIRSVGEHTVSIRLQSDLVADVKVIVKALDGQTRARARPLGALSQGSRFPVGRSPQRTFRVLRWGTEPEPGVPWAQNFFDSNAMKVSV